MFSQLFGKYLVEKGVIGYADYREAVEKQLNVRVKLGTIAVAEGLLTVEQAETINKLQKQFDKRFGDIAVEKKYLTEEQVEALLKKQGNPYMQFLEVLLDSEKASISEIETEFAAFQKGMGERVFHSLLSVTCPEQLRLEVVSTNQRAIRFYEKMGMLKTAELRRWYCVQ